MLNGDVAAAAEMLSQRIVALMKTGGLPTTLAECGVTQEILPVLAEEANQQWTARFNPRPVTEVELLQLYEAAV